MNGFLIDLLALSGKAACVAAVIWLIHRLAGRWLPASFRLALWALVAIRLLAPSLPESPLSVIMAVHPETTLPGLAEWLPTEEPPAVSRFDVGPEAHQDFWLVAAILWVGGVIYLLARRLGAYRELYRWVRSADPAPSGLQAMADRCRRELGLKREVRVLESAAVPGPATFGVWRPVVLLPDGFEGQHGEEERRHMLLHELAHIRRWDPAWLLLAQSLVAMHWFNPMLWWAQRQFHVDLEAACDATVLSRLEAAERPRYGRTLLEIGSHPPIAALSPAFAVSSKQQLSRRIVMITRFQALSPIRRLAIGALGLALVAVTLTEIPSAFAGTDSTQQVAAALLAQRVSSTFASTEGTPVSRASDIAQMIEKSGLPAPVVAAALLEESRRVEEQGDAKLAHQMAYLAEVVLKEADHKPTPSEIKATVTEIRNAGTMMFRRVAVPNFGDSPSSEAANIDRSFNWSDCPTADYAAVQEAVGADLELPRKDGWGRPLEFCLDVDVDEPRLRIGVRSAGSDGRFADQYDIGPFPSTDSEQDIVWVNGYFMRWPTS